MFGVVAPRWQPCTKHLSSMQSFRNLLIIIYTVILILQLVEVKRSWTILYNVADV